VNSGVQRRALLRAGAGLGLAPCLGSAAPWASLAWKSAGAGAAGLLWASSAQAGAQVEEPLAQSVRSALSAAVADAAPPRPAFDRPDDRSAYVLWLGRAGQRLQRYKSEAHVRTEFLEAVWYESRRAGLETELVLGLIQVESGFRKFAISSAGARGFMQVMPFWPRLLGQGDASMLFQWQANVRFACVILRHYIKLEDGDLAMALGRYNGSRGQTAYPQAVLAAQQRWQP